MRPRVDTRDFVKGPLLIWKKIISDGSTKSTRSSAEMLFAFSTGIGSKSPCSATDDLALQVLMCSTSSDFNKVLRSLECAPTMSETTTEVVEELSPTPVTLPTAAWPKWTISNLPGLLPFLPKVPGHKESIGILQQLSPKVIKSECILTRRFWTLSSSKIVTPQPKDSITTTPSRVQTIRNGTTVPTTNTTQQTSSIMKKQDALFILSMIASAMLKLSMVRGLQGMLPKSMRPSKNWLRREFLTNIAVYSGLIVLVVEGSGCLFGLLAGAMPPGLIFMISALVIMMVIAVMTIGHDPNSETHALLSPSSSPSATSQRICRRR
ncbi:uncharacterized protein LOC124157304 [Ischnura elegans]|uniref:uncharacterized protein LOC124157304 n=1 Tax=Ischnura elegans TaxID=197161 RepID=UPI001ED898A5|nr:uncharacterized protein LOC124157304 [Ischnura elegans]